MRRAAPAGKPAETLKWRRLRGDSLFGFGNGACYRKNMPTDGFRGQETEDRAPVRDTELLRRYADEKSEAAFGELVRRHVNLVYSVALRQCGGDAHLAQDVAQRVFTALARKARQLSGRAVLGGWLYRSAQFAASDVVRAERRRRAREQEAHAMQKISDPAAGDADWQKLAPVLDQAIGELATRDRDAVVLRFFEGRPFAEIGAMLRLTEDAARRRVERALDKLRAALVRRGITSTTAALGVALANQAAATAPAGVAASVAGAALTAATASASAGAWLAFLTMSKIKVGIVSAVVVAFVATSVVELRADRELRAELNALRSGGDDPIRLRRENQKLNADLAQLSGKNPEADELVRLRARAAVLKARPPGVTDATLKPATAWRNAGRATVEAANETFLWSLFAGDLDAAASVVVFSDDTPENREKFMAHFSDAVRVKYRTPERLVAAAVFGAGEKTEAFAGWRPDDAFQVIGTDDHVGGDGLRFGQVRMRVWYRNATGESEGDARWQPTPEGWAMGAFYLTSGARQSDNALAAILTQINPMTGERLPLKK